tara:strand:+ start:181 stop:1068 length:888 start_codon:yes stop_codon:yes gene_type:complete
MSQFTPNQLKFFNASQGAGSIITDREFSDSQLTVDAYEKIVLYAHIPVSTIPRGAVSKSSKKFDFSDFNTGAILKLNLNIPKPAKTETRLYLSQKAGFKPRAGDYWFIFEEKKSGKLTIGSIDQSMWLKSGGASFSSKTAKKQKVPEPREAPFTIDDEDHIYQSEIYSPSPAQAKTGQYKKEKRSKVIANKSLRNASYKCELDSTHQTFNLDSGAPYIEAHHLVPLSETMRLGFNLDFIENIVALCPNCHRAVHYAEKNIRADLVGKLFHLREKEINRVGIQISLSELLRMYNCL